MIDPYIKAAPYIIGAAVEALSQQLHGIKTLDEPTRLKLIIQESILIAIAASMQKAFPDLGSDEGLRKAIDLGLIIECGGVEAS